MKAIKGKEYSVKYTIVENLRDLNERYIKSFIDLDHHQTIINDDFYIAAQKALSEQYIAELELMRRQGQAETNQKFYLADSLASELEISAHRRRFSRKWDSSETKEVLDERVRNEVRGFLSELRDGIEPHDEIADFIDELVNEFVPYYKYNRYMRIREGYLTWLLTDYADDHNINELFDKLTDEFSAPCKRNGNKIITPRKREKFLERNGEYLMSLLTNFLNENRSVAHKDKSDGVGNKVTSEMVSTAIKENSEEAEREEYENKKYENGGIDLNELDELDKAHRESESNADKPSEQEQEEMQSEVPEEQGNVVEAPNEEEPKEEGKQVKGESNDTESL